MNRVLKGDSSCVLEARDLTAVLGGKKVLDVASLKVNANEAMMIIGPNGSGKTTLLLCLALLHEPATGAVFYRVFRSQTATSYWLNGGVWP
jgi:ABC-type cobalamin/Fe3+-siderophores transport system ATPase subunit